MTYRLLVTGSRHWTNQAIMATALAEVSAAHPDLVVVHGAAPGADSHAGWWCHRNNVKPEAHRAQWLALGKAAGPIRNTEMVELGADECVAFKDDLDPALATGGTEDCVRKALAAGISVRVFDSHGNTFTWCGPVHGSD